MLTVTRSSYNPILKPNRETSWEAEGVFNGCPIKIGRTTHLFYRALSLSHFHALAGAHIKVSDIGHAESKNGHTFSKRERFIVPEKPWELFGCEDPRVTKFRGKYYIFYTALSKYPFTPDGISVGLAISKDLKSVTSKHHVTPFNSKAMALFPGPVNGKICAILTANTDRPPAKIAIASFRREEEIWSHDYWNKWYDKLDNNAVPLLRKSEDHIEVGAPPIATRFGWLLIYSYIRNYRSGNKIFGIEAALLDRRDPRKVIARSEAPLLVPDEEYELYGNVPNIVFPSGALVEKGKLNIYYGATDTTCCVASVPLEQLLKSLKEATKPSITFTRFSGNPIIYPDSRHVWETKATFNTGAIYAKGKVHLVYRALDQESKLVF